MEAAAIISTIGSVIKLAVDLTPAVIKTVEDAKPFAQAIYDDLVNKKQISHADLLSLEAKLSTLSQQLQAPLPTEDDQDV